MLWQGAREALQLPPEGEPALEESSRDGASGPGLRDMQPELGSGQPGLGAEQPGPGAEQQGPGAEQLGLKAEQPAHQQQPPPKRGSRDSSTQRLTPPKVAAARVLLVTAHPDDECMFFSPTLSSLAATGAELWLLCLSTGARRAAGFKP